MLPDGSMTGWEASPLVKRRGSANSRFSSPDNE